MIFSFTHFSFTHFSFTHFDNELISAEAKSTDCRGPQGTSGHHCGRRSFGRPFRLVAALLSLAVLASCQANMSQAPVALLHSSLQTKIVGGALASHQDEFSKTTVSLFNVAEQSLCTASILSDSILITAGHCVDGAPSDLRVIFGPDVNAESALVQEVLDTRTSVLWPIRQTEESNSGDIALVRFNGGLPAGFHAVQLLTDASMLVNGASIVLAGYGVTDSKSLDGVGLLHFVQTTIRDARFSESEIEVEQSFGKGSCHGDSGGPALINFNGSSLLFGITSRGARGARDPQDTCSVAALYTNLIYYRKWINETRAELTFEKF